MMSYQLVLLPGHTLEGVELIDLTDTLSDYRQTDALHRQIHAEVLAGTRPDTLIALEYQPTFTAGRATKAAHIPNSDVPVIEIDRGGSVTWHGPGQLVCYPIVRLGEPVDVIRYIRSLEQCVIKVLDQLGIKGELVEGRAGVWILKDGEQDQKICAMGIKNVQGVTMHGIALNVDPDFKDFGRIIPCGLFDAGVTSLAAEGVETNVRSLVPKLYDAFQANLYRAARREG